MKRLFALLFGFSLCLGLAACGSTPAAPTEPPLFSTEAPALPDATEAPTEGAPKVDESQLRQQELEQELYRDEKCAFTVIKAEYNEHLGLQLYVLCENNSDRQLMFTWNNTSVCGFAYDPLWAEAVAPGKKVTSTIDFDTYALGKMGVESVDEVVFTLSVLDSEEFMDGPLVNTGFAIYPTGKAPEQVVYPEYVHRNGETVITDNDVLTFIIEDVEDEVSEFYTLNCYLANHTGKNLMVSWDSVSVNGCMADPFWGTPVPAGTQAFTQISFLRSDLEAQGIEDVSEIEFTLMAYDDDNWDADYLLNETFVYNP